MMSTMDNGRLSRPIMELGASRSQVRPDKSRKSCSSRTCWQPVYLLKRCGSALLADIYRYSS